jgi:CRP/FNR family transcriptional regulator
MQTLIADVLRRCPLFARVTDEHRQSLVALAKLQTFETGQRIFSQGEPCPGVFIVASGLVRVFKLAPNGKEHVLHLVSPGQTFAEVAAIGMFNVPANAQALADTECVLLPARPFMELLRSDHALCLQIMTGMALWVRSLIGLLEDITLRDATGRVARLLGDLTRDSGEVQLPAMKKHMASHLNLTSETLSRTLRRLSDAEIIDSDAQTLHVRDREALARIAEGDGF